MKYHHSLSFSHQTSLLPIKPPQNPTQLLVILNSHLSKLTNSQQHSQSLLLFSQIHSSHFISPDHYTLSSTLKSCTHLFNLTLGAQLHSFALRTGLFSYSHVSNSLLSFYAKTHLPELTKKLFDSIPSPDIYSHTTMISGYVKYGQFKNAHQLFDEMPTRTAPAWNAMITGYVDHGYREVAIELFVRMCRAGVRFDRYSLASVLSLCDSVEFVGFGWQVHSMVIRTGFLEFSVAVVNALVTMYFDCGVVWDGVCVFREASVCDAITYNGLIAGFVKWERNEDALVMFKELMRESCLRPTELTHVSVLTACLSKEIGDQVYGQVVKIGLEESLLVSNATVSMYSGFGDLVTARRVFDTIDNKDIVSWNSMMSGYSQANCHELAIELYSQMLKAGMEPDGFTYGSLVSCSQGLEHAQMVQAKVVKNGLMNCVEVGNALISAYTKCNEIDSAYQIFHDISFKNLISWNSIITGTVSNGFPMKGIQTFLNLLKSELKPNSNTLSTVLSTCGTISTLRLGEQIHGYILKSGSSCETVLGNSLITMYVKCGDLDSSSKVFSAICQKDVVSWNAIIAAYSQNGDGHQAMHYFKLMQNSGIFPDRATFTIVLSACSHAGLIDEGQIIFLSMIKDYGIDPQVDHYSCIIDLLSRAGHLEEAERLINSMPCTANPHIWWTLLSACSTFGNVRLGRIAAKFLMEIEPENAEVYVTLSNINAAQDKWEEAANVREQIRNKGVMKKPGCSWIE